MMLSKRAQGWIAAGMLACSAALAPAFAQGAKSGAAPKKEPSRGRQAPISSRGTSSVTRSGGSRTSASSHSSVSPRLGVVLQDNARIYRKPDSRSPELFRCGKGTALGLVGQTSKYYAVLMVDRSYGFIDKSKVELYNSAVSVDTATAEASNRLVQKAVQYLGVPYVWGGNSRNGIDCSGFVQQVYRSLGVSLPRTAREQFTVGTPVRWGELVPGDRLYFCFNGSYIDHTGLYIGGGRFIHASGGHGAVVVSSVTEAKYYRALVGARRTSIGG